MNKFYENLKSHDSALIECVPNVSTYLDSSLLERIKSFCGEHRHVHLLHIEKNTDAERSVITVVGSPNGVFSFIDFLFKQLVGVIDINDYTGVHPSVGVVDVIPFIPLTGIERSELLPLVEHFANYISFQHELPIYFYGSMASSENRRHLSQIRRGGLPVLKDRIDKKEFVPDIIPTKWNENMGCSSITVRELMVAFNIDLKTADVTKAQDIARCIRAVRDNETYFKQVDYPLLDHNDLLSLKALAWVMQGYGNCQISTNIYDPSSLTLEDVFYLVKYISGQFGVAITGSELIGVAPLKSFQSKTRGKSEDDVISDIGLTIRGDFNKRARILEYILKDKGIHNKGTF